MHPTVRILVGSVAFLSVSILSSVEQAPYVQAGDDAEAFTGDGHRPAGMSQAGLLCKSSCVQALPPECSEAKSEACIQSCFCSATIERPARQLQEPNLRRSRFVQGHLRLVHHARQGMRREVQHLRSEVPPGPLEHAPEALHDAGAAEERPHAAHHPVKALCRVREPERIP